MKMKVQINQMSFQVPSTCVRTDRDGKSFIQLDAKESASIVKQYVQQKYPDLKVWATSDKYAGGSSARVYVCNADASPVSEEIHDELSRFGDEFAAGRFNGMIDLYEYRDDEFKTDDGMPISNYCSYVFVENRPKFNSAEDVKLRLHSLMAGNYVWGVMGLQDAIKRAKSYGATDKIIESALQMM